jgi:hypothetical protein
MLPSALVDTADGDPLLSTARTHVRMPSPRRSWAFDQPVLATFRTFCLAVCAVTALQLLSASGSRWGGHRVPIENGSETPCRSDAAFLHRPYGGALKDLSVLGGAGAVARAFPFLFRTVEGHDAAEVGSAGRDRVALTVLVAVNGAPSRRADGHVGVAAAGGSGAARGTESLS